MKCPMCFALLPAIPVAAVCQGTCPELSLPWASEVRGYDVSARRVFEVSGPLPVECPDCRRPTHQEICRVCAYPVPAQMRGPDGAPLHGTFIAMAGARATGKSLLIASMVQQFKLLVERAWSYPLLSLGTTESRFTEHYLKPLYETRQLFGATPPLIDAATPTREPLIFGYRYPGAGGQPQMQILVIRDVAGEDLESVDGNTPALTYPYSFFARADAVLSLLDPLKVPHVRQYLSGVIPVPTEEHLGADGLAVLGKVLTLMRLHAQRGAPSPALGLVLSKFDLLQQLRDVEVPVWQAVMGRPGAPIQRDPSLSGPSFDPTDGDLLHHEVSGLLELLEARSMTSVVSQSGLPYRFFATSALGGHPVTNQSLPAGGIAPYRVLDPIKWALYGAPLPR